MTDDATADGQGPNPLAATANDGAVARTRPLPVCPLCGKQLVNLGDRCQFCSGDLRLLIRVVQMADQYFNRAVVAARRRRWWEAAENLAVTVALREDDVEALILLGKVRKRGGKDDLAKAAWAEVLRYAPDQCDTTIDGAGHPPASARHKSKKAH